MAGTPSSTSAELPAHAGVYQVLNLQTRSFQRIVVLRPLCMDMKESLKCTGTLVQCFSSALLPGEMPSPLCISSLICSLVLSI